MDAIDTGGSVTSRTFDLSANCDVLRAEYRALNVARREDHLEIVGETGSKPNSGGVFGDDMGDDGDGADDYVPGMGGADGDFVGVVGSTVNEEHPESGPDVLQSMGYADGETGARRADENRTDSKTSVLQTIVILAIVAIFVSGLVYFLLSGILALFGIQL